MYMEVKRDGITSSLVREYGMLMSQVIFPASLISKISYLISRTQDCINSTRHTTFPISSNIYVVENSMREKSSLQHFFIDHLHMSSCLLVS